MNALHELTAALLASPGFAHKRDIGDVLGSLARALPGGGADLTQAVAVGDDCAAIPNPNGEGYLLFAIEGFLDSFVQAMPWFAGYCGVMVNVSDICAMGGRPIAVVDALWSDGMVQGGPVLAGLAAARRATACRSSAATATTAARAARSRSRSSAARPGCSPASTRAPATP